jgi:hypothetical protein
VEGRTAGEEAAAVERESLEEEKSGSRAEPSLGTKCSAGRGATGQGGALTVPHPSHCASLLRFFFHTVSFAAQISGSGAAVNDYYSPVKAAEYIELRLRPAIDFYQKRVPTKTRLRMTFKLVLLTATVASSFLARHQSSQLVTIITAFASMIIAYSEFADADRKVER